MTDSRHALRWAALRRSATLAHSVPSIVVRLRVDGEIRIDVGGAPRSDGMLMTACEYRHWIAAAWGAHQDDPSTFLLSAADDDRVSIEIGLPPCGAEWAGGVYRTSLPGRYLYVAATTTPLPMASDVIGEATADRGEIPGMWGVGLRHDPATGTCLLYCETDTSQDVDVQDEVVELMHVLVARLAVSQLIDTMPTCPTGEPGSTD